MYFSLGFPLLERILITGLILMRLPPLTTCFQSTKRSRASTQVTSANLAVMLAAPAALQSPGVMLACVVVTEAALAYISIRTTIKSAVLKKNAKILCTDCVILLVMSGWKLSSMGLIKHQTQTLTHRPASPSQAAAPPPRRTENPWCNSNICIYAAQIEQQNDSKL